MQFKKTRKNIISRSRRRRGRRVGGRRGADNRRI
jgi:hypothetical protein